MQTKEELREQLADKLDNIPSGIKVDLQKELNMEMWNDTKAISDLSPVMVIQQMQLQLDRDIVDLMFTMPDVMVGSDHNFTHMQMLVLMMIGDVIRNKSVKNKLYANLSSMTHHRVVDIEAGRPVVDHGIKVDVWSLALKVLKKNGVIKLIHSIGEKEYYPVRQFNTVVKKQFIYPTLQTNCGELFHYVIKNNINIFIGFDGNLYISNNIKKIKEWSIVESSLEALLKTDDGFYIVADRVKLGFVDT